MTSNTQKNLIIFLGICVLTYGFFGTKIENVYGADFFAKGRTVKDLLDRYTSASNVLLSDTNKSVQPFKILIVPGHDDKNFGAMFRGIREADINLELAKKLADNFKDDNRFLITLSRDDSGYNKNLERYFDKEKRKIEQFISKHKREMKKLLRKNKIDTLEDGVYHNDAPSDMVLKLYGINKWVDENSYDLVLHIHFNDHPGRMWEEEGNYNGFAIYVPEEQYINSEPSKEIAKSIIQSLELYFPVSNMPKEDVGVVEDQELIAIGAYNTLQAPSLLIEYGYLYEPQFTGINTRPVVIDELALRTYAGVKTFFEKENSIKNKSVLLPHIWEKDMENGQKDDVDVLKLQAALYKEGVYPPQNKTLNDCPLRGEFGNCTEESVKIFQERYGITPTGVVGPMTRAKLNEIF